MITPKDWTMTQRPIQFRMSFPFEGAEAIATLDWEAAPCTCEAVLSVLPFAGISHHGIYSGSECVLLLDKILRIDPENARHQVTRGEVAFTWMSAGSAYGVDRDFAELCWFYDIDAEPRMWGGPVDVSIFARIEEPADEFYAVCRRMRREGTKPLRVEVLR